MAVQVENATAQNPGISLGPEPIIPAQRLRLRLGDKLLVLGTDGLSAFDILTPP